MAQDVFILNANNMKTNNWMKFSHARFVQAASILDLPQPEITTKKKLSLRFALNKQA
jgi:hypothetical protein